MFKNFSKNFSNKTVNYSILSIVFCMILSVQSEFEPPIKTPNLVKKAYNSNYIDLQL